MARALGDTELKQPRVNRLAGHNLTDLDGVETGLKPGRRASADLVSNKAHFNWRRLQGGSLLFLSSDGIGNEKDAESAARTATTLKMQGHTATQIAEELTKRAGKVQGADNCTVLIVILEAPSGAQ
jgi:protein phosphatase 2C family protein 2/3